MGLSELLELANRHQQRLGYAIFRLWDVSVGILGNFLVADGPVAGWNVGQGWPGWVGCQGVYTCICASVCVCVIFFGCGLLAIFLKKCVCVCLRHSRDVYTDKKPSMFWRFWPGRMRCASLARATWKTALRRHSPQVSQLQTPHVLWRLRIPDRVLSLEFFQQACPTLDPIQYWCLRIRVDLIMYIWLL